jgi:hypothetical protein
VPVDAKNLLDDRDAALRRADGKRAVAAEPVTVRGVQRNLFAHASRA